MIHKASIIGFELTPLPDELVYGWLARYRQQLGSVTSQKLFRGMTGYTRQSGTPLLPMGLREMANHIHDGIEGCNRLIRGHTAFPYFASFAPAQQIDRLASAMLSGWGVAEGNGYRISPVVKPATLRYCRACRAIQLREFGQATWNRIHQMPGVFRCHEHDERLFVSRIPIYGTWILSGCPIDDNNATAAVSPLGIQTTKNIARLTAHFMRTPCRVLFRDQLRYGMSSLFNKAGWLHDSGHFCPRLWQEFSKSIGEDALEQLGCRRVNSGDNWIHGILCARCINHHPLHYILLFDFLKSTILDLNSFPFTDVNIQSDPPSESRLRTRSRLGPPSESRTKRYRDSILSCIHAGHTRANISRRSPHRIRYMMAYDREWLDLHAPFIRACKDHSDHDTRLMSLISTAISHLQASYPGRRLRITLHSITQEARLSLSTMCKIRDGKLPQTLRLVEAAIETVEQHRVRVLQWTASQFLAEGTIPTFSCFIERAGFTPKKFPNLRGVAEEIYRSIAQNVAPTGDT